MSKMIKNLTIIALTAVIGFSLITCGGGGGGGGVPGPCDEGHAWGLYTQTTPPTCDDTGIKTRACTRDGCTAIDPVTETGEPALGHNWQLSNIVIEPTCTSVGQGSASCMRANCNINITNGDIPALGHTKTETPYSTTQPTCTADGTKTYRCVRFGACNHTFAVEKSDEKLGHTRAATPFSTTQPTCTADGTATYRCVRFSSCNHTFATEKGDNALGHTKAATTISTTQPTCTADGAATYRCTRFSVCNYTFAAEKIDKLGHDHTNSLVCKRTNCNHKYAFGDYGPGGGIIFYVADGGTSTNPVTHSRRNGFTVDGYGTAYYLEAAPTNAAEGTQKTFPHYTVTREDYNYIVIDFPGLDIYLSSLGSGTSAPTSAQMTALLNDIGKGKKNTALIVQYDPCTDIIHAAQACTNYSNGGKNDWFLPSMGELCALYWNRSNLERKEGITLEITSTDNRYWSSSQYNQKDSYFMNFWYGGRAYDSKWIYMNARPIRAF